MLILNWQGNKTIFSYSSIRLFLYTMYMPYTGCNDALGAESVDDKI